MTNEEAIKVLRALWAYKTPQYTEKEIREALDLAIQALETGEIYITGEDYNLYMEGYKAGKRDFEPKQGEWGEIFHHQGYNYHKCSKCCFGIKLADYDNFCPNCGADMRKGSAENDYRRSDQKLKTVQAEFNGNWIDYGGINQAFELAYKALEERQQSSLERPLYEGVLFVDDYGINKVIEVDEDGTITAQMIIPRYTFIEAYNKFIKEGDTE